MKTLYKIAMSIIAVPFTILGGLICGFLVGIVYMPFSLTAIVIEDIWSDTYEPRTDN